MDNHAYCRVLLKMTRRDLPKGITTSSSKIYPEHYAVYLEGKNPYWLDYSEHGACCAFYARAQAIAEYLGNKPSDYHCPPQ